MRALTAAEFRALAAVVLPGDVAVPWKRVADLATPARGSFRAWKFGAVGRTLRRLYWLGLVTVEQGRDGKWTLWRATSAGRRKLREAPLDLLLPVLYRVLA